MSTIKPRRIKKHTSDKDRETIVRAYEKGYNMKEIADMLQLKRSTVSTIIRRFRETGHTKVKVRSGSYARVIESQHVEKIREWMEADHDITLKQIVARLKEEYNIEVSKTTVARARTSIRDTLKTPRNVWLMARKSLLLSTPDLSQGITPSIDPCIEANPSPGLSRTVSNTPPPGSSRSLTPPPGPSRALTSSPEPSRSEASLTPDPLRTVEASPPGPPRIVSSHRRTLALNRRREQIDHSQNQMILNALETVSAATNRLVEESRPQTDEAIFGTWVGDLLSEWSPPRKYSMKVAIRKMMLEADIARYREHTGVDINTVVKTEVEYE